MATPLTFTPAQAAVITGLSLRWVQKAIDGQRVPVKVTRIGKLSRRSLSQEALVCLHLESSGLALFPPATRKRIIADILRRPTMQRIQPAASVTVNLMPSRKAVSQAVKQLRRAEALVCRNPEVLSGTPVFKGTRVPVYQIALELESGSGIDEILADYPSLSPEQVKLAPLYVKANPKTGRPPARRVPSGLATKVITQKLALAPRRG